MIFGAVQKKPLKREDARTFLHSGIQSEKVIRNITIVCYPQKKEESSYGSYNNTRKLTNNDFEINIL